MQWTNTQDNVLDNQNVEKSELKCKIWAIEIVCDMFYEQSYVSKFVIENKMVFYFVLHGEIWSAEYVKSYIVFFQSVVFFRWLQSHLHFPKQYVNNNLVTIYGLA